MFLRHSIVVILMLCAISSISPSRWLKKQLKKLNNKIDVIDTHIKDIKEEIGNGPLILYITIDNELPYDVTGDIVFNDNYRQKYSVAPHHAENIVPLDDLYIKRVSGKTSHGVLCSPYVWQEDEDPKRKFHIVEDGNGGCVILPASQQYHHIGPTHWYENGELVTQQDHFHPGTREAVLKSEAHGNNHATTIIFQARNSTRSRKSTGSGLMVTAAGTECFVNHLTDELGDINPEHMLVPQPIANTKNIAPKTSLEPRTIHKYVKNVPTAAQIISPDDDRVKLTETMKKECKGRTIYYNTQHLVEEELKTGITSVQDKDKKFVDKILPPVPNGLARDARRLCPEQNLTNLFSHTEVSNCGTWLYSGVTYTSTGHAIPPQGVNVTYFHYHVSWVIAAQCCNEEGTDFFPCAHIKTNNDSSENERAFSTAFALSIGRYLNYAGDYSPYCLGMSRFCEWSSDSTHYDSSWYSTPGACTSHCNDYCNNYYSYRDTNAAYPNGCFKCYGMYPGFVDPNHPKDYPFWYRHSGPCTPGSQLQQDGLNGHITYAPSKRFMNEK